MEETSIKDEVLVEASQNGSSTAFHELMKRHMPAIFNFVRQYARTPEDAEDITQEAFFKAWRHISRFEKGKAFRPWLYAIARNAALDNLKKRRASTFSELDSTETDLQFTDTLEDDAPLQHEIFEQNEIVHEIDRSMESLHPDHRRVMQMHYREDMTFNEIAGILGKPMNTVKSWHRRALAKIKKYLPHRHTT